MKGWFFNFVYLLLLAVFSPVLLYRSVKQGKYRHGFRQKFLGRVPRRRTVLARRHVADSPQVRLVWFHAVSVGEVNLLRPILERIRRTRPDWQCVVSTTSRTGMTLAKKLYGKDLDVFYCPLDFTWAVDKALGRLRPDLLVLAEQELWPNLVDAAKRHGARVAVINGRFGEGGYKRYRLIRPLVASMLRQLDAIAAQSETYAGWFRYLGASTGAIRITGSMKFDGAQSDRNNPDTLRFRALAGMEEDDIVFLAGSTQSPEEAFAVECYEHLKEEFPRLRLVLVPRHPERFDEVAGVLEGKAVLWERRSQLSDNKQEELPGGNDSLSDPATQTAPLEGGSSNKAVRPRILLVDTVGELGGWWGTASIAFVGGSMGSRGGQNMIEPAAYGAAVCFGPNTKNFRDIVDLLLRDDAAAVVQDQREMEQFVRRCLEDPAYTEQLGVRAGQLVARQLGATERTLEMLESLFRQEEGSSVSGI